MATNTSIIHWQGKLGPVIAYTVRGHNYLRTKPSHIANPRTQAQQHHRSHFSLASSFAHFVGGIYKIGYQYYNTDLCPRANFVSHIYHHAIRPNLTIDLHKLLISRGSLPIFTPTSVTEGENTLTLRWSRSHGDPSDTLNILIFNATQSISITHIDLVRRADGTLHIPIPPYWQGDHIIVYCFWHNRRTQAVSDSVIAAELNNPDTTQLQTLEDQTLVEHITHNWVNRKYLLRTAATPVPAAQDPPPNPD